MVDRIKRAPRRRALVACMAALAASALTATGAQAKVVELTGSTTIAPSAQTTQFLAANGITVRPTVPATAANGAVTLPIVAGFAQTRDYTGILVHTGGLRFVKGAKSVVVRRLVAVRTARNALVLGQVPGRRGGCAKVAAALRRFAVTHPRLVAGHPAAARKVVRAVRRYCAGGRVVVLARIANAAKQVSGTSATLTADLLLSRESAGLVNRVLGTSVRPGAPLGSASSSVTVG